VKRTPSGYEAFLKSATGKQWARIGIEKRSGVATPLFSIYSKKSVGIGEIPDLTLFIDWCRQAGLSLLQLLPMNDVGFSFTPYDAESSFALEPMYLSPEHLFPSPKKTFTKEIANLRKQFPIRFPRIDYGIKRAKLDLFWKIFEKRSHEKDDAFKTFVEDQSYWIRDYARFKVLKEKYDFHGWSEWSEEHRRADPVALARLDIEESARLEFYQWLQWQLFTQFTEVKRVAGQKGVLLVGDLPFLVSRDSADVWAHQSDFKLDFAAGAPPDLYFAEGQRWGMPPYNWDHIASESYAYLIQKLKTAELFYDIFRVDHFVGVFRLWSFPLNDPHAKGAFDPSDEHVWEDHGRRIVSTMINHTSMLPCAEDLGTIPACSYQLLREFSIPGMEVQRWTKDWGHTDEFKSFEEYRANSIAVISTHDTTPVPIWWQFEAETVDEALFRMKCESRGIPFDTVKKELFDEKLSRHGRLRWKATVTQTNQVVSVLGKPAHELRDFIELHRSTFGEKQKFWNFIGLSGRYRDEPDAAFCAAAIRAAKKAQSIFSIHLIQDWLSAADFLPRPSWDYRINMPGIVDDKNWKLALPFSLDEMLENNSASRIRQFV